MLLSAVSVLVVAQSSSEIPEGLMNNSVLQSEMCLIWISLNIPNISAFQTKLTALNGICVLHRTLIPACDETFHISSLKAETYREANSSSVGQKTTSSLWNLKVCYLAHHTTTLVPNQSQISPLHVLKCTLLQALGCVQAIQPIEGVEV